MIIGRSSVLLMLLSATVWATVPVFFALGAELGSDPYLYTSIFNGIGALLSVLLFIAYSRSKRIIRGMLSALKAYLRTPAGKRAILLDGGGIAASNATFIYALSFGSNATVTLIVESWPLLAAFLLATAIRRLQGLSSRQVLWTLVALTGFYFLVVAKDQSILQGFQLVPVIFAVFSALTQAVAVTAHQRALQDLPEQYGVAKNFLLQGVRMGLASALTALIAIFTVRSLRFPTSLWWSALGLAVAIMVSALLYAMSLQAAKATVVTMMWFLTPVISIILLAAIGLADLTTNIMVGATLVISANIFLQEKLEATVNVTALVCASVGVGTLILHTRGLVVTDYFNYVQIISAFYGILQGFLLTRLWDRRMKTGALEEKWNLLGRGHLSSQTPVVPPTELVAGEEREDVFRDAAELNVLRQEIRSYSEAVLLTILGVASAVVLIVGRPNALLGDVLAFLIPVAIVYLLVITWSLIGQSAFRRLVVVSSRAGLADAITSYFLVVSIFGILLLAIVVKR